MKISNSETAEFNKCEMSHWFGHILGIKAKKMNDSLAYGVIGHDALAIYYRLKMEGADEIDAQREALKYTYEYGLDNPIYLEVLNHLRDILKRYWEFRRSDNFRIISVEGQYGQPLIEDVEYVLQLDLLVEFLDSRYRGQLGLIDHKFTYNFWPDEVLEMTGQMPKYFDTVRQYYPDLKWVFINQLRYREMKDMTPTKHFKRSPFQPKEVYVQKVMSEQMKAAFEIRDRREMPIEQSKQLAKRTLRKEICERCSFLGPCRLDLLGQDISSELKHNYKKTDYGY